MTKHAQTAWVALNCHLWYLGKEHWVIDEDRPWILHWGETEAASSLHQQLDPGQTHLIENLNHLLHPKNGKWLSQSGFQRVDTWRGLHFHGEGSSHHQWLHGEDCEVGRGLQQFHYQAGGINIVHPSGCCSSQYIPRGCHSSHYGPPSYQEAVPVHSMDHPHTNKASLIQK